MATTGYDVIKNKKDQLIRKGLAGSVYIAPSTSAAVTESTLFDPTTGDLVAFPTGSGYEDLGYLTTDGAKLARAVKTTETDSWGSNEPTRVDIDNETNTMVVECQETKLVSVGLYTQQDLSSLTIGTNGAWSIQPPSNPTTRYYRVLAVAVDTSDLGEFVIARFFPRASVTDITDQVMSDGDNPITWGVTFTAYQDSTLGYAQDYLFGGAACLALKSDMALGA